jgi:RES domain-containing protein
MPISGAGAAKHGGRVNRPGVEALYLSLDTNTAILEYKQVSTLLPPGMLTSYHVIADPVVDFTQGYNASSWDPIWQDFYCDWRELWFNQHIEPPSWGIGDEVIAGAKGILFRSHCPGGDMNLVLYPETFRNSDFISVYDPDGSLQKRSLWGSW